MILLEAHEWPTNWPISFKYLNKQIPVLITYLHRKIRPVIYFEEKVPVVSLLCKQVNLLSSKIYRIGIALGVTIWWLSAFEPKSPEQMGTKVSFLLCLYCCLLLSNANKKQWSKACLFTGFFFFIPSKWGSNKSLPSFLRMSRGMRMYGNQWDEIILYGTSF